MSKANTPEWGEKLNTSPEFLKTSQLEVGQSFEGTILAFKEQSKFENAGANIVMRLLNGETRTVTPSGNLKYAVRDGLLKVGSTYKIQKEGTKKVKGMTAGVFGIYLAKNANLNTAKDDII